MLIRDPGDKPNRTAEETARPESLQPGLYRMSVLVLLASTAAYASLVLPSARSPHLAFTPTVVLCLIAVLVMACALLASLAAVASGSTAGYRLAVVSALVCALGSVAVALAPDFTTLVVARVMVAVGAASSLGVATLLTVSTSHGSQRRLAASVILTAHTAGIAIGMPTVSVLVGTHGPTKPFLLIAALCAMSAALIGSGPTKENRFPPCPTVRVVAMASRLGGVFLFWLSMFVALPQLVAQHHENSATVLTLLLIAYSAGVVGGSCFGHWVAATGRPRAVLLLSASNCAVLMVAMPGTGLLDVACLAGALGFCSSQVIPATNEWHMQVAPQQAPLLSALGGSAMYLGMALGGLIGAVVVPTAIPIFTIATGIAILACLIFATAGPTR